MVKGISRQVIVVQSPDKRLFDQAIFILRDEAVNKHAVTDEDLLKEARYLLHASKPQRHIYRSVWAMVGGVAVAVIWLLTVIF